MCIKITSLSMKFILLTFFITAKTRRDGSTSTVEYDVTTVEHVLQAGVVGIQKKHIVYIAVGAITTGLVLFVVVVVVVIVKR